ncbi:hypothetical protein DH2020_009808 [Rehmannia glutinosa]|uniref:RRM domain-containing protein n=1 Tax=Rehmannia glutinosa TaxID=99300 RepID=A0ABR0X9T3_REHGL
MADAYWRYGGDARQQPLVPPPHVAKRPRSAFEMTSGHGAPSYYAREDERTGHHVIRNTDSANASFERYLLSVPGGPGALRPVDPRVIPMGGSGPAATAQGQSMGMVRPEIPLPPNASGTLFVEDIFRPFVGYKEVRLVTKEPRHSGGDPLVLCFVDFQTPVHASKAMDALQGYKLDEHDRESTRLKLQFARYPGARSFA